MKNKHLLFVVAVATGAIAAGGGSRMTGIDLKPAAQSGDGVRAPETRTDAVRVHGTGTPETEYALMRSHALGAEADWQAVGHATAGADGALSFEVSDGGAGGRAFYRMEETGVPSAAGRTLRRGVARDSGGEGGAGEEEVIDVCADFGADGSDGEDDSAAFRNALAAARDRAAGSGRVVTVAVPVGTYQLASSIPIYSNTRLSVAADATIVNTEASGTGIMVFGQHVCGYGTDCPHGGYGQIENVTIEGGTWDANDADGQSHHLIFQFRHGRNIAISNAVCKNAANHFINLSGVSNAVVENVVCEDAAAYVGDEAAFWGVSPLGDPARYALLEAIHTDYLDAAAEGRAFPLDGTPSRNVRISGCTFRNVFAGAGTHHYSATGEHGGDFVVSGNAFELKDSGGNCINLYGFTNVTVTGNTVCGRHRGGRFLHSMGSTSSVAGNRLLGLTTIGCFIAEGSEACIADNELAGGTNGICLVGSTASEIRGNVLSGISGDTGIKIYQSTVGAIRANRLDGVGGTGIKVHLSSVDSVEQNAILGMDGTGIRISESAIGRVRNNKIVCTGAAGEANGLFISGATPAGTAASLLVQGNTVTNASARGIALLDTPAITLAKNTTTGTKKEGIVLNGCPNALVNSNVVASPGANGMVVQGGDGTVVKANTIKNAKQTGLLLAGTAHATVQANQVSNSTGHGIAIVGEAKRKTAVNVVANTSVSSSKTAGMADIRFGEHCTGCTAKNNILGRRGLTAHASARYTESGSVVQVALSKCKVTLSARTLYYNGKAVKPAITVTYGAKTLKAGTDYAVSWQNNNAFGTATAAISGKGRYAGTVRRDFKIVLRAPVPKTARKVAGGVQFVWSGSKGAAKYRIFRKVGSGKFAKLADTAGTSWVDKAVRPGKTYTYTVRCLSANGKAYASAYDTKGKAVNYTK